MKNRDILSAPTVRNKIAVVKSFLASQNPPIIDMPWKGKVNSIMYSTNFAADDRAPTVEEIRKLSAVYDVRLRGGVVVLMLKSDGFRIEAFNFKDDEEVCRHANATLHKDSS